MSAREIDDVAVAHYPYEGRAQAHDNPLLAGKIFLLKRKKPPTLIGAGLFLSG